MRLAPTLQYTLLAGAVAFASGAGRFVFSPSTDVDPRRLSETFVETSARAAPSVVRVATFEERRGSRFPTGQGSGVVVDSRGLIVTNNHVVARADSVVVALNDGRQLDAEIVGTDPDTDLALLRVEADDLRAARLRVEPPEVGEWVLAMGNPFGLGHTVTAGIISGQGRSDLGLATFEDFLQTDAAINPGNSGGPLIDLDGRVVGINTAVGATQFGSQGIGFAIPSKMVADIAQRLQENGGRVRRGWLGVYMAELTDNGAQRLGYRGKARVAIDRVVPESPAERAGLASGDLIVKVRGLAVGTSRELLDTIAGYEPGTEVELEVWRDGRTLRVPVLLTAR